MSFLSYSETRPWAKSIREAVLTRKMPPWFADPGYGRFANDRSLSPREIVVLAEWANSGAPPGDPKDAPPPRQWPTAWRMGTPDAVMQSPADVSIPARGVIEYQYLILPTRFAGDKWVERVEVRPSNRAAVHHAVVYIREPGSTWLASQPAGRIFELPPSHDRRPNPKSFTTSDILTVYTPGNSVENWGPGAAKKIKAGSDLVLQMHYTATGAPGRDRTQVGVTFSRERPKHAVLTLQMGNDRFVIPAGDPDYRVSVSGTLPRDAQLIGMLPHMHLRGKAFEYQIAGANGALETLLKVNNFDFNWQIDYRLSAPRLLRAGTRLLFSAYFDNSKNNPRNPDPAVDVRFGEQSWEEMMIGFFDVLVDPDIDKRAFFERNR